jgi:hypothetical protein
MDGSCFTVDALRKIAKAYNEKSKNEESHIDLNKTKEELVDAITFKLRNKCNDQVCWLRDGIIKEMNDDDILNNTFRPEGPTGKYDWLSTLDINDVISQYHDKHSEFLFLGAVPYDFQELPVLELHHDDLFNKFETQGKHKIGLVINLDTHNMPGSHWVALYADLRDKRVYFFDSVGKKPGVRIRRFINKIVRHLYKKSNPDKHLSINDVLAKAKKEKQVHKDLMKIDIKYNFVQHQFDNSECGVYSINFILRLLEGENFEDIITNITKDETMNKNRKIYFRNVN